MKKTNKSFLGLYLIVSFVLIITAVVVSLTAGLNLGIDIGGGSQIEVKIENSVASKEELHKVQDVLKHNKLDVETIFVEDKDVDTYIVVRVANKDIENVDEIRTAIAEALSLDVSNISSFVEINSTLSNKTILWSGVAVVAVLALLFVAGWIRYGLMAGVTATFTILHTIMLNLALVIITRLPLTFISVIIMLSATIFVLVALVLLLEKIRENSKLKHNENLSVKELVQISEKSIVLPMLCFAALVFVVGIVFLCVPVKLVCLSALTLIISLIVACYSAHFIGVEVHKTLVSIKVANEKARLSRNVSPKSTKKVDKTTDKKSDKE